MHEEKNPASKPANVFIMLGLRAHILNLEIRWINSFSSLLNILVWILNFNKPFFIYDFNLPKILHEIILLNRRKESLTSNPFDW